MLSAGIKALASFLAGFEGAKSSQLCSPSASHRRNDFIQNGVDDLLNVTVVEMLDSELQFSVPVLI